MNRSSEIEELDFSHLTIRKERINGSFYYYGYQKISGTTFKTYLGRNLDKLNRMQKIHQIAKKYM